MIQDTDAGARLVLDGALTMRTVDAVRATLLEAIERPSADGAASVNAPSAGLAIDCTEASEVDLTFIQLLIAARVTTRGLGRPVSLASAPDGVLLDALTRGGFQPIEEISADGTPVFWFAQAPG
jgi:ABC-type transporter Mla MlaB component